MKRPTAATSRVSTSTPTTSSPILIRAPWLRPLRCSGRQRCDPHHHQEGQEGRVRSQLFELDDLLHPFVMPKFQNTLRHERNRADDELGQQTRHADFVRSADFFQTGFSRDQLGGPFRRYQRNQTYASASAVNSRYRTQQCLQAATISRSAIRRCLSGPPDARRGRDLHEAVHPQPDHSGPVTATRWWASTSSRAATTSANTGFTSVRVPTRAIWSSSGTSRFLKGVENPWWITNRELNETVSTATASTLR